MPNTEILETAPHGASRTPPAAHQAPAQSVQRVSKRRLIARRYLRNRSAVAGLVVFVLLVLFATVGPFIGQWDHDQPDFLALKQPPSAEHWFGTDQFGRDTASREFREVQGLNPLSVVAGGLIRQTGRAHGKQPDSS